ncbi:sensor histidine kinase [Weissella kandleri]|uniref:sensor histidine kinase n=1 Tax=Weissella kandleri TaxID=1616 RepID=UPI00387E76EA
MQYIKQFGRWWSLTGGLPAIIWILFNPLLPSMSWAGVGVLVGTTMLLALILMVYEYRRNQELERFNRQMQKAIRVKIQSQAPPHGILLPPNHPLAPLAYSINTFQTELQATVQEAQHMEKVLQAFWENAPVGMLEISGKRQIVNINRQAAQLLGLSLTVKGKHFDDVITQHNLMLQIEQALNQSGSLQQQMRWAAANQVHDVEVQMQQQVISEHDTVLLVFLYDVTELIQMQQMQSRFLGDASHELKTPLTSIIGFTSTLLDGAADDPKVRQEFLTIINQETQRLLDLTQDILALIKTDTQVQLPRAMQQIDLGALVQDILAEQRTDLKKLHLKIDVDVPAKLVALPFNETSLRQIISNLISNAVKYNVSGGEVRVKLTAQAQWLMIQVADTGIGISSGEQNLIFNRFYRVDRARNHQIPGTGLGLAIVHDLIQQLDGQIALKSQVGVGTTIDVRLPL